MKRVTVLGTGLVGRHIVVDLAKNGHKVLAVDAGDKPAILDRYNNVTFISTRLSQETLPPYVDGADVVVNCLPGYLGYECLKQLVNLGKDVVDISFMPEDVTQLREAVSASNVTVVPDIGVAPGMCGAIVGYESTQLKNIQNVIIEVGGLPLVPEPPHYYKAPFSPIDVIEEYTRPVRLREDSIETIKEPLSDLSWYRSPSNLVSFNTDGLRTLLNSFPDIPNMVEKTVRYDDHVKIIKTLKEAGFFSAEHVESTAKVLLPAWKLSENDKDFTTMKVTVSDENNTWVEWILEDEWTDGVPSMARTTGYTATAAVELLLKGELPKGLVLPEELGKTHLETMLFYLAERGVCYARETRHASNYKTRT